MEKRYIAECICCGTESQFADARVLQDEILAGEVGEYLCADCL